MPENIPGRMPEDMPDRMPEDMSDRMPEDLPVTKCINVMVGITRSKVIVSGNLEEPVHLDGSQHTQEAHQPSSINQHGPAFQDWCQHLGVITDAGNAVEGIKAGTKRSRHGSD